MSLRPPFLPSWSGSNYQNLIDLSLEQIEDCLKQPERYNLNPDCTLSDPYVFKLKVGELAIAAKVVIRSRNPLIRLRQESLVDQLLTYQKLHQQWQRLTPVQQSLLTVCLPYGYVRKQGASGTREVLLMEWVDGKPLSFASSFSREFCDVFRIPTLQSIRSYPQLALHRAIDSRTQRQDMKLQIAWLFHRLRQTRITIWGLNRRNILQRDNQYVIIDPTSTPLSGTRFYNWITAGLIALTSEN